MQPLEIMQLAASLATFVNLLTIGLTGAFKVYFPNIDGKKFAIPCGASVTAITYLVSVGFPAGVRGWLIYAIVCVIGGLMPSGLFDAGVNFGSKISASKG